MAGLPRTTTAGVTAHFALPDEFLPYRCRDEYSTEETALFKVSEEHKPNWAQAVTPQVRDLMPADTHFEYLFNDLLRNRVSYQWNPNGLAWSYSWRWGRTSLGADILTLLVNAGTTNAGSEPSHAVVNSAYQPHGDILFALRDKEKKGLWVDGVAGTATTMAVTLSPAPAAVGGNVSVYIWEYGIWRLVNTTALAVGTGLYNFTITQSGYHTVILSNPAANTNMTVNVSGTCGCWGHFYAPYSATNGNSVESCRLLGQSILVRNIAAPLNQQGNIIGVQPGKNRYWYSFVNSGISGGNPYTILEQYAGAGASRVLATGIYGFKKGTDADDFKLKEPFIISDFGSSTTFWTDVESTITDVTYLVVGMQCTTAAGKDLIVRTVTAGEYETGNEWFNVEKPRAEPSEWRDGMEALASMQQWYDNPMHWGKILRTIGSVASVGGRIMQLFPQTRGVGVGAATIGDALQ